MIIAKEKLSIFIFITTVLLKEEKRFEQATTYVFATEIRPIQKRHHGGYRNKDQSRLCKIN